MDLNWNVIEESSHNLGRFKVILEKVKNDDCNSFDYSYVSFSKNGICVLPIQIDKRIVLIKQYRRAVNEWVYEVPAGLIDENETPEQTAARELTEETGYVADRIIPCGSIYPSPGSTTEKQYLFVAYCSKRIDASPEKGELITVHEVSRSDLISMIDNGEIMHGGALVLINWYLRTVDENRNCEFI
jgi:ADP-ribose pyrophosphatase